MKSVVHIFLFIGLCYPYYSFAQSYQQLWKSIDSLEKKGLPESALTQVRTIRYRSVKENNSIQYIKASVCWLKFSQQVYDDSLVSQILSIQQELLVAPQPQKQLIQSYLAEFYSLYSRANQWQFMARTTLQTTDNPDFSTWDLRTLKEQSGLLFRESLKNSTLLLQTKTSDYESILTNEVNTRKFAPTLFDVLANRYISYLGENFSGAETTDAELYTLYNQAVFQPGSTFLKTTFPGRDTLSTIGQAYSIFQQWLQFHRAEPEVFADIDLRRLNWFKSRQGDNTASKSLYETAMIACLKQYENLPVYAEIAANLANSYRQYSQTVYSKRGVQTGKEDSISLLKARKVCQDAITKFPDALMTPSCRLILNDIESISYSCQVEELVMPETPILLNFTYKNLDLKGHQGKLFGRLVKVPDKELSQMMGTGGYYSDEVKKAILKLPVFKELNWSFPGETDLISHSAEGMIPGLPAGAYVLLLSAKSNFQHSDEIYANSFCCSSIAYSTADLAGEKISFALLNRQSGRPVEGAKIEIYHTEYNYAKGNNRTILIDTKITNKNGIAILEGDATKYNLSVSISHGEERYWSNRSIYFSNEQDQNIDHDLIHLFTDRSIYRPGQTVYFKGIFTNQTVEKSQPLTNRMVKVVLKDANYQDVADLNLKTNEFGSFQGSFLLPKGKLNGEFKLYTDYGQLAFSVEEYKRPKFEAHFVAPATGFKLGDTLKLELEAKTWTGLPVENAKVELTVARSKHSQWKWYRGDSQAENRYTLSHTFKTTDKDGKLALELILTAPSEADANDFFDFQVDAIVTDLTGESHATAYAMLVGSKPYRLQSNLESEADLDTLKNFYIQAINSVGKSVKSVRGTIKVYAVKVPNKAFQKRYWPLPDRFILNETTFKTYFPDYAYKSEEDRETFPKKQIQVLKFNTSADSLVSFGNLAGNSLLWLEFEGILGTDTFRTSQFLDLFSSTKPKSNPRELLQARLLQKKAKPGETISIELCEFHGLPVLMEVFSGRQKDNSQSIVMQEWIETKAQQFQIKELVLQPEWGNNLSIVLSGCWGNKKMQVILNPELDEKKHSLQLQVESFRDVMEPGKKEIWRLKITDEKGKPIQSEILATLYDASLDQIRQHSWEFNPYELSNYVFLTNRTLLDFGVSKSTLLNYNRNKNPIHLNTKTYSNLNWFGFEYFSGGRYSPVLMEISTKGSSRGGRKAMEMKKSQKLNDVGDETEASVAMTTVTASGLNTERAKGKQEVSQKENAGASPNSVTPRKNFNETAFFLPQLKTDEQGNAILEFTVPEALTKWKLMALASSKDLQIGKLVKETITRKSLMVNPNWPRFFREGDTLVLSAKINLLNDISGAGLINSLELINPITGENLTSKVVRLSSPVNFSSKTQGICWWQLVIPSTCQALELTISARNGDFTDAERITIPVLPNRIAVTETLPLELNPGQNKTVHFEKLEKNSSTTLSTQQLKLEYTSNPSWLAVQSLPYLMEGEKECAEQIFNRYYSNLLGSKIVQSNPKIKAVFDKWGNSPGKFEQALGELAENTPWLREAISETDQKRRVARLFDLNQLEVEQKTALEKLIAMQTAKGGFPWFTGMPEDRFITQHILEGFAHLRNLDALKPETNEQINQVIGFALTYLDQELKKEYDGLKKEKINLNEVRINELQLHYLYVRSLFEDKPFMTSTTEVHRFYTLQMEKYWTELLPYSKGLMALIEHKSGKKNVVTDVVKSLRETAIKKDDLGMYWKNDQAWYWYSSPVETNALMMEVFSAVKDKESINALTKWLLKNKQTNHWKSSKATADACYALLMQSGDLLETGSSVKITIGNQVIQPELDKDLALEAGTGYFSKQWLGGDVSREMGKLTVQNQEGKSVSWGAVYWTYMEQLDKVEAAQTSLKIKKELYKMDYRKDGLFLVKLGEGVKLKKGDRIKVRIEIEVDRPMEYVRLSDSRAACFEPIESISGGHFQEGLYYYQSPKDQRTDFFIHYLPKGNFIFEYPLSVQQSGAFSNGISTLESMYAPEFSSHSQGIRLKVEE